MEIGHSFNSSWNKHIHCQQFEIRVHIFAGLTDISTNLTEAIDKTTVEMNTYTPKKNIHTYTDLKPTVNGMVLHTESVLMQLKADFP